MVLRVQTALGPQVREQSAHPDLVQLVLQLVEQPV